MLNVVLRHDQFRRHLSKWPRADRAGIVGEGCLRRSSALHRATVFPGGDDPPSANRPGRRNGAVFVSVPLVAIAVVLTGALPPPLSVPALIVSPPANVIVPGSSSLPSWE
jgi:hypothetical protein